MRPKVTSATETLESFPNPPALPLCQADPGCARGLARALLSLTLATGVCLGACSSSGGRRDMNYGTDVAVGFVPPDGPRSVAADAALDMAVAGNDVAGGPDGGAAAEVSGGEGN